MRSGGNDLNYFKLTKLANFVQFKRICFLLFARQCFIGFYQNFGCILGVNEGCRLKSERLKIEGDGRDRGFGFFEGADN